MSKPSVPIKKQLIKNITPMNAFKLIEKHKNDPDFIILDVRTLEEFSEEHIEGAKNLDYHSINFEKQLEKMNKEKKYLIYCASGGRATKAMEKMKNLGFMEVYNMEGGFILWSLKNSLRY
jgi:rhodanese-related sulfurtransferase